MSRKTPVRPYRFFCTNVKECPGVSFETAEELGEHLKLHREVDKLLLANKFPCDECEHRCPSERSLVHHKRFAHRGGRKAIEASLKARGLDRKDPA